MNGKRSAGLLLAFAAFATAAAGDSATVADVASVPVLKPTLVLNTPYNKLEKELKLELKSDTFSWSLRDDPETVNEAYRREHPLPEMFCVPLVRGLGEFSIESFGVEAVQGFRSRWTRGENGLKEESLEAWRWRAPQALQRSVTTWVCHSRKDAHAALVLSPLKGEDRDPLLLCFDALSGLRWRAEVPLLNALKEAPVPGPLDRKKLGSYEAHLGITADGSRLLVSIPLFDRYDNSDLNLSVLFVYDGSGALRRTLFFPGRRATDTGVGGRILRAPQGSRFLLSFYNSALPPLYTRETYLIDGEGNLLYRFVDEQGRDVTVTRVSEDEKSAYGAFGWNKHYIYTLPKQ